MAGGGMNDRARQVVVVDDDEDLRELIVQLLEVLGFESLGFPDGGAALAALRRSGRIPDVIVLDLEMPGMTGWDFRREQLRDPLLARIPVAVASGTDPGAIEADAFLTKPYELGELCRVIARLSSRAAAA
jgi:CheY-like chemotaxis protein